MPLSWLISSNGCCGLRAGNARRQGRCYRVSGADATAHTARLGYLRRQTHALGDVVMASDDARLRDLLPRNNVLHCFALPGLIACPIAQHGVIGKTAGTPGP